MTRNNTKRNYSPSRSIRTDISSNDDNLINLPDLSGLNEEEKRHILNVLLRDENVRNKHLARFMQLRKEVADLEQRPQPTSDAVCARCLTPFGYIFNTGDACPKCNAKVCKQCRLMYNVNDNGWLCQLCCKQMQLMSYSGEWIYSFRSNLRKDSVTASEIIRKSLTPSISIRNLNDLSSSDTETESTIDSSERKRPIMNKTKPNQQNLSNTLTRMVIPSTTDEEKLNALKKNVQQRPTHPQIRELKLANSNIPNSASSDDVDSLYDRSPNQTPRQFPSSTKINTISTQPRTSVSTRRSTDSLSTVNTEIDRNNRSSYAVDCASVTSSEWGADSEVGDPTSREPKSTKKYGSRHSLSSRMHIGSSVQSLRDAVHRIPKPHLSSSRTSLNSELKKQPEQSDTVSIKIPDKQSKSSMYPTWSSG
ncbi:unnamed protein product [Adineta steineri]|uniref:RabBD domain-containing protein n=1 Tax=Adineta steineri TaxID=433720 RepID=A0A813XFW4_9BILA|nr:unnamed protein product [Adineta steineri]CAF0864231.1 unnamed protein product [Adineta steineri]